MRPISKPEASSKVNVEKRSKACFRDMAERIYILNGEGNSDRLTPIGKSAGFGPSSMRKPRPGQGSR